MNIRTDFFSKFGLPLCGALLLLQPSWGAAKTRSVNCDSKRSIGQTLKTLSPGDTLLVRGICLENVEINGETGKFDGITLDGLGSATISGPDPTRDTLRLVAMRGVTVRGFTITGGRDAIHVRWSTKVFILNNIIEETGRNGIQVTRGSWVHISDNLIRNNPGNGIQVEESRVRIGGSLDEPPQPLPNVIQNNVGQGIVISRASIARISGNTIANNGQNGIQVVKMSQADIASNTIEGNSQNGIRVMQNSGVNLGADSGSGLEQAPNSTPSTPNGQRGINCSLAGYADGRLGSLTGTSGATLFTESCLDSLSP